MTYGHQGGWDEIALVLVPIAVMVVLLALAKHRAERGHAGMADMELDSDDPVGPPEHRRPPA